MAEHKKKKGLMETHAQKAARLRKASGTQAERRRAGFAADKAAKRKAAGFLPGESQAAKRRRTLKGRRGIIQARKPGIIRSSTQPLFPRVPRGHIVDPNNLSIRAPGQVRRKSPTTKKRRA